MINLPYKEISVTAHQCYNTLWSDSLPIVEYQYQIQYVTGNHWPWTDNIIIITIICTVFLIVVPIDYLVVYFKYIANFKVSVKSGGVHRHLIVA